MKKKHFYLILCFLWMAVIFWFSAQVGDNSQGMSDKIIIWVGNVIHYDIAGNGGWLFDVISFIVRKAAHMSEYALLAILFSGYLRECGVTRYWQFALAGVFLYACSDEIHQLFVEGRSGQLSDVMMDCVGGSIGLMLQQGYTKLKNYKNLRFLGK